MKLVEKENEIKQYKNEIDNLKKQNFDLKKKIQLLENNKNNNTNIDNNRVIESLEEQLKIRDNIIKELKEINGKNKNDLNYIDNLIPVIFQSIDYKIHYAFICKKTDKFHIIEEKLYEKYPEYIESENYFTVNGIKINKYKTFEQNNIKYSDIILLNKYDN